MPLRPRRCRSSASWRPRMQPRCCPMIVLAANAEHRSFRPNAIAFGIVRGVAKRRVAATSQENEATSTCATYFGNHTIVFKLMPRSSLVIGPCAPRGIWYAVRAGPRVPNASYCSRCANRSRQAPLKCTSISAPYLPRRSHIL